MLTYSLALLIEHCQTLFQEQFHTIMYGVTVIHGTLALAANMNLLAEKNAVQQQKAGAYLVKLQSVSKIELIKKGNNNEVI